jgi:hypothetical protein
MKTAFWVLMGLGKILDEICGENQSDTFHAK